MNQFKSYLGVFILLLGVVMLVVYKFLGTSSNVLLWGSLVTMVVGLLPIFCSTKNKAEDKNIDCADT